MRECVRRFAGAVLILFLLQKALGQSSVLEPAIPAAGVPDGPVWSILALAGGKILAGGGFDMIGGEMHQNLARLHNDGSVDAGFVGDTDGDVYRMIFQPDGTILLGGSFSDVQGLPRQSIARLFADGTVDPDFDASTNYSSGEGVLSIAVQSDGKIVTASYVPFQSSRLQRLNADGTLDTSFANTNAFDYYITALLPRTNGTIWVGGGFQHVNSEDCNAIAVVADDGSVTVAPDAPLLPYSDIFSFVEETNGGVLVGGVLKHTNSNTTLLSRLTPELAWDVTYNPNTIEITNLPIGDITIGAMVLQPDGKLVVAGNFKTVAGYSRRGVARFDSAGQLDTCFDPGLGFEGSIGARSLSLQGDGQILVGGFFSGDTGVTNIARLLPQSDCDATHVYLLQRIDGMVSVAATCTPGGTNFLESSENLVDWITVGSSVEPYLPFCDFSIESPPAMFFRVRKEY